MTSKLKNEDNNEEEEEEIIEQKPKIDPTQSRTTQYNKKPIVKLLSKQSINGIKAPQQKYIDELFPAERDSIYSTRVEIQNYKPEDVPKFLLSDRKLLSQYALKDRNKYTWKRLSELYNVKDLNIMIDDLSQDIVQGELGDCYFLSALSRLAENPTRIKNLLPDNIPNEEGFYKAVVYLNGEPTEIAIDDNVPIIEEDLIEPQIAFTGVNPDTLDIWPVLLEKVWAKCNLCYEDIISGNCGEAFEFLTPAPVDSYFNNANSNNLFEIIQDSLKRGYIIEADISDADNTNLNNLAKMGLITNHGYSVIGTAVLKGSVQGRDINLIKMKNIWGTNEWRGDWSNLSTKWTREYKNQVDLSIKEEGEFWISYDDYIKFYTTTHICHINDKYRYIHKKFSASHENPFNIIKVEVPQNTEGYFIINLKNKRIYRSLKGLSIYDNPFCSAFLFKYDSSKLNFTLLNYDSGKQDRLYFHNDNIEKGTYYICVTFPKENKYYEFNEEFPINSKEKISFRAGFYSPLNNVKIDRISKEDLEKFIDINFLHQLISYKANEHEDKDKHYFTSEGENDSWRLVDFKTSNCGFGYIYYQNNSDAYIKEKITFTDITRVNIIPLLNNGELKKPPDIEDDEIEYEEENTRIAVENLRKISELNSTAEIIRKPFDNKPLSEDNSLVVQLNIAPHSKCAVLLQKNDNVSSIDFTSDICFDYLPIAFLTDNRFRNKKYKLQYNQKPINIYEIITEHNTGVFFHYKNKTSDIICTIGAHFDVLTNLTLVPINAEFLIETPGNEEEYKSNSIVITINPGESKFFALKTIDAFRKFNYNSQIDYRFTKVNKLNLENEDEENEENEEEDK